MRRFLLATFVLLLAAAVPAYAKLQSTFPRMRIGIGDEPTAGGGVFAGANFVAHSAVIAWNRKWNNLNLYLLPGKTVTCGTLRRVAGRPGHLIQVYVTRQPHVTIEQPVQNAEVAFVTVFRNPKIPMHVSGLKRGAQLTFTRVDTYPGGVWHGIFKVPQRVYGDGKLYAYSGTFAAKWCQLRR